MRTRSRTGKHVTFGRYGSEESSKWSGVFVTHAAPYRTVLIVVNGVSRSMLEFLYELSKEIHYENVKFVRVNVWFHPVSYACSILHLFSTHKRNHNSRYLKYQRQMTILL